MPAHSSINQYRSEFLANFLKQKVCSALAAQSSRPKYMVEDEDDPYVDAFDTSWTYSATEGKKTVLQFKNERYCYHCFQYFCHCSLQECSHDLCIEYTSKKDRNSLMRKYFSEEEIETKNTEILQDHRKQGRYCPCTWVLIPMACPSPPPNALSNCTISYFETILRPMIVQQHKDQEEQEKIELLAKYGLTLAEYEDAKRNRVLGV